MINPTIIIGLGGQGSAIALGIKQRLEYFAASRDNAEAELAIVRQRVRIYSLDVDHQTQLHGKFDAASKHIMRPSNPDRLVQGHTGFLANWWPDHITSPGSFDAGCGGMRAKGRLAYYLSGYQMADRVLQAISDLRATVDSDGQTGGAVAVYVYIVGSLGGGTGSGSLLTMAMDLRARVDPDVRIIGAIPTASIMKRGPGKFMEDNVFANTFAGLRELEWWLTPPEKRPVNIVPFFQNTTQFQTQGNMPGDMPFDFCYLFTEENRAGVPLDSFQKYTELIADCIAMDINAPASDAMASLNNNIFAQTLMKVAPPESNAVKPIVFAAAGTASIVYSTHRTSQYLGEKLLAHVLKSKALTNRQDPDAAHNWLIEQQVLGTSNHDDPIRTRLQQAFADQQSGEIRRAQRPRLQLDSLPKSEWTAEVQRKRRSFDDTTLDEVVKIARLHQPQIVSEFKHQVRMAIEQQLDSPAGDGFAVARGWLAAVAARLKTRLDQLSDQLQANSEDPQALLPELDRVRGRYDEHLKQLTQGRAFLGGIRNSNQQAIDRFTSQWWVKYTELSTITTISRIELLVFEALHRDALSLLTSFDQVYSHLSDVADNIQHALNDNFSNPAGPMAKEDRVLGAASLVDEVFRDQLREATSDSSISAAQIAQSMIGAHTALRRWLLRDGLNSTNGAVEKHAMIGHVQEVIESARETSSNQFKPHVERLSLWEAMIQEFYVRVGTSQFDSVMHNIGATQATPEQLHRLLPEYLSARVQQCVGAAAPQWKLDTVRLDQLSHFYAVGRVGLAAFSLEPFADRSATTTNQKELQHLRSQIVTLLGSDITMHTSGQSPHHFIVTVREWGAPLLMLDAAERQKMVDAEAAWRQKTGHTYIDQRYVDVLPKTFEREELQDIWNKIDEQRRMDEAARSVQSQQEAATFALGVALRFIRKQPGSEHLNGTAIFEYSTQETRQRYRILSEGLVGTMRKLKSDTSTADRLETLIAKEYRSLSPLERNNAIAAAIDWVEDEIGHAEDTAVFDMLDSMKMAVKAYETREGR